MLRTKCRGKTAPDQIPELLLDSECLKHDFHALISDTVNIFLVVLLENDKTNSVL